VNASFPATAALADRIKILRRGRGVDVILSRQYLLNCCHVCGTCDGGFPPFVSMHMVTLSMPTINGLLNGFGVAIRRCVNEQIHKEGIPEESCLGYIAKDQECDPIHICRTCNHEGCFPVTDMKRWFVSEYGGIIGVDQMKAEIYHRGPISCGMYSTEAFHVCTVTLQHESYEVLF
jgi:cathepsin X